MAAVGRAVASNRKVPQLESSDWNICLFTKLINFSVFSKGEFKKRS